MSARGHALALLGIAGLACVPAYAQEQCALYYLNSIAGPGPFPSAAAAAQAALAQFIIDQPDMCLHQITSQSETGVTLGGGLGGACESGVVNFPNFLFRPISSIMGDCPPIEEECSGLASEGVGDQFTSDHSPGADGYCNPVSRCKMAVTSSATVGGATVYTVKHTSENCANAFTPAPEGDDAVAGENCVMGSGAEFCLSNQGENCGFLNDNFVCLPQIEDDGCEVFGDGSRVCGAQAPTPPVPDSGTPGDPATPDEQIVTAQQTFNFYSESTVTNSARPPGSSGDNPFDGEDDGDGSDGDGDGDGEGDDSCPDGATCDGTLPDEFEDVCTFQECTAAFFTRIQEAPIPAALASAGASFPAGACPNWSLSAFSEDYSLSAPMCDIWEQVSPMLSAVFLVIWGWVATRIVLTA